MKIINKTKKVSEGGESLLLSIFIELFLSMSIIAIGWFLIGYYTHFEFLQTGYQDWIYQAFRVQSIERYGITSWEHVWTNGLNHWRAYQYIPSELVYVVVKVFHLSITKAMLWVSAISYIFIRIMLYGVMRILGIRRVFAFFATVVSYAFAQQWIDINDFSIFIAMIIIPLYTYWWIKLLDDSRYFYFMAAVSGALWSLHPVIGYSLSGLWILSLIANREWRNLRRLWLAILVFFLSSLPFSSQYLFTGYNFSNPILSSSQFLKDSLLSANFGLSLLYFIFLVLCWFIFIMKSPKLPRWAKLLLFYCSLYLFFIYLGQQGYFPDFINKFQFLRAVPLIAFLLSICFGIFFNVAFGGIRSRIVPMVLAAVLGVAVVNAIDLATVYSGQPMHSIQDSVAIYFSTHSLPSGSVYFENVSEASYFAPANIRYVTSYNEHLEPNPYTMRFNNLMRTGIAYTGISATQIKLIENYATVLGVSHLFIPTLSPLVAGLTKGNNSMFKKEGEVVSDKSYTVLKNIYPIANAYVFESENTNSFLQFSNLPKPTLNAESFQPWDNKVTHLAQLIRSGQLESLPMNFIWPNRLTINMKNLRNINRPVLFISQSFDKNWIVENDKEAVIKPTSLRFMSISFLDGKIPSIIRLSNNWSWWHWPIQSLGFILVAITSLSVIFRKRKLKNNNKKLLKYGHEA